MPVDMHPDEQALDHAGGPRDKYRPIARIGRGGMAEVLLAVLSGPGQVRKLLVLKRPLSILTRDPDFNARFLAEARIAARLNHPNVISTFEVGTSSEGPFIVMEYLDGQPLSKIYRRLGALQMPLSYRLHVLRNLLAGLDYVHTLTDFDGRGLRLVHRDVSPQNVFICYDGRVTLVDFGIAKAEGLGRNSRPGIIEGKIAYMAPEQLAGRPADHRADLFAFGVILWETLTGERISLGGTEEEVIRRRTRGEIPDIRQYAPETPQPLVDLCQRILTLLPEDRIPSAASVIETLDAYVERMGARINDREVGQYIGHAFSAERDSRRRLIESQMALVEQGLAGPGHLPDLSRAISPSGGGDQLVDGFAIRDDDSLVSSPGETTRATISLMPDRSEPVSTVVAPMNPLVLARRKEKRRWQMTVAIVGACFVSAAIFFVAGSGALRPTASVKPPVPKAAPAVARTAPVAPRMPPAAAVVAPQPAPAAVAEPPAPPVGHAEGSIKDGAQNITIGFKQLAPTPAPRPAPAAAPPSPAVAATPAPAPAPTAAPSAVTAGALPWPAPRSSSSKKTGGSRSGTAPGANMIRPYAPTTTRRTIDADNPYATK